MHLIGQLLLVQAQTQVVAQVPIAELALLRVLVQAAVLELALGLQLERELPVMRVPELELAQESLQVLE